jgi:hypothetical protein
MAFYFLVAGNFSVDKQVGMNYSNKELRKISARKFILPKIFP